ncbi:hypothetical protein [Actinomadura chokoriensis]|uniref:hypothetical protein n=1 Tax=Actinomadura chokoriensis TaxID=454156 RepID=UPI0031F87F6D
MTSALTTPAIEITQPLIDSLIALGGYTHPLFTPGTGAPMPGQAVLLLMGGLVEQSGLLDHAIALLELREVRFLQMLKADTTLHVELTPGKTDQTSTGKQIQHYTWTAINAAGTKILKAQALMLTHRGM